MSQPLYKLTESYKAIESLLDSDNFTKEEVQQTLASIQSIIEEKAVGIAKLTINLNAEIDSIKAEEERLTNRRQALQNKILWLKDYLLTEMTTCNLNKIKSDVLTITVQNNPVSVEVTNLLAIPEQYTKTIIEPNKQMIIDRFKKDGYTLPGVNIITDKKHIVIR